MSRTTWGGRRTQALKAVVIQTRGTTCVLCGDEINLSLAHPHPQSFTIEHIIPRSRGGTDSLANLAPAHLTCNSARGNREPRRRRVTRTGRRSE